MIAKLKQAWRAAPVAVTLLAMASVVALFFSVRLTAFWIYWQDPAHRDQDIAAWMTPGYIAHSWRVPRELVIDALDAPKTGQARPLNLEDLSLLLGIPVDQLIARAEAAIGEFRAGESPTQPDARP